MYLPRSIDLVPRYYCSSYGYGGYYNCQSAWYRWGRWVLTGVVIFFGILLILTCVFCTSRRRRRARRNQNYTSPMVTSQPPQGNYAAGSPYNQQGYAPPPGAPPGNAGYYGPQSEVAQPGQTYQPYK